MAGFQARLFALEGAHFRTEDQYATQRHLEKLVADGKLPSSSLEAESTVSNTSSPVQSFASDPLRSIKRRPASEVVYQHVSNGLPGSSLHAVSYAMHSISGRSSNTHGVQHECR